jgi:hypothetical protein
LRTYCNPSKNRRSHRTFPHNHHKDLHTLRNMNIQCNILYILNSNHHSRCKVLQVDNSYIYYIPGRNPHNHCILLHNLHTYLHNCYINHNLYIWLHQSNQYIHYTRGIKFQHNLHILHKSYRYRDNHYNRSRILCTL